MKDEREYLLHISECIETIQQYTLEGRSSLDDLKTQDAVIRRLQVMVESCLRLSDERKAAYPEVGWQHLRNFRNRMVHDYLDVDMGIIWAIIEHDLGLLKSAVSKMLDEDIHNADSGE